MAFSSSPPILPDMKNRLPDERSQPDGLDQPVATTHVRWVVLSIVMAIMAVTALNRLNLSIAGKYIEEEFSFNTISMGMVFGAFLWGYALFQVPWGYVCDRIGPRRTLTASILCFAVASAAMVLVPRFAAATGITTLAMFRLVRFLTGIGEAAVSSNVTRVIASWTGLRERGFAGGLQVCGLGLGGTLTPIAIAWTMVHWGWRASFAISAALAFVVVALRHGYVTDWPGEHPSVNPQEIQIIHPANTTIGIPRSQQPGTSVPWIKMLTSVSVWVLILGHGVSRLCFLR
jgi:MFS transporter, ACS family, glucarate transporter